MELLDHASEYAILKGVNCYESLGRYYLAHETSVPEELYEYMNLDALGCRYEDEHPGVFVGNAYVQYPSPVSYTHLDVYKRQAVSCTASRMWMPMAHRRSCKT